VAHLRLFCSACLAAAALRSAHFIPVNSKGFGLVSAASSFYIPLRHRKCSRPLLQVFMIPTHASFSSTSCCIIVYASADVLFDGDCAKVWRERKYADGDQCTVVAFGAMCELAINASQDLKARVDIWNPFVMAPLCLDSIVDSVKKTGKLLVVQESTEIAGLGDQIISHVCRRCFFVFEKATRIDKCAAHAGAVCCGT